MQITHITFSKTVQKGGGTETFTATAAIPNPGDTEKLADNVRELKKTVEACMSIKAAAKNEDEHPNNEQGH